MSHGNLYGILVDRMAFEWRHSPNTAFFLPVIISNMLYTYAITEAIVLKDPVSSHFCNYND